MSDTSTLPPMQLPVLDETGRFILPWYRKFQGLSASSNSGVTQAQLDAVDAVAVEALADAEAALAMGTAGRIVRFYGALEGYPAPGQNLFEAGIEMVGDEVFPAGLTSNLGSVATAPASDATFPINVTDAGSVTTQIGYAIVYAGTTVMAWVLLSAYAAAAKDVLQFSAPTPADSALTSPRYTFVGTRS